MNTFLLLVLICNNKKNNKKNFFYYSTKMNTVKKVYPDVLAYSKKLKGVAIDGSQTTHQFLPSTSGSLDGRGSNILRIPINSSKFLGVEDAVLRFKLQNTTANPCYIDGSANSVVRRITLYGPDGTMLEFCDQYGRLYHALSDAEMAQPSRSNARQLLEGYSKPHYDIRIGTTAAAGQYDFYLNNVLVGSLTRGTAKTIRIGDFVFATTGTNTQLVVNGNVLVVGTASTNVVNGVVFDATASGISVAGQPIDTGTAGNAVVRVVDGADTANTQTVMLDATTGYKWFCVPIPSWVLKSLQVYLPGSAVGGQGLTLEVQVAPPEDVLTSSIPTVAPTMLITDMALHIPSIQFDPSADRDVEAVIAQTGALSLSCLSWSSQIYPYVSGASAMSIPLNMKYKSLKSLLFFFQQNPTDYSKPRTSGRTFITPKTIQIRSGSNYYPAAPVAGDEYRIADGFVETLRGLGKYSSYSHAGCINHESFVNSGELESKSLYAIDFETAYKSLDVESGLDNASSAQQLYLEITNNATGAAGTCYIFALYDQTISLLPNKNIVPSR